MPTEENNIYYQAGRMAFKEGKHYREKPKEYFTSQWEQGWIDALAELVKTAK